MKSIIKRKNSILSYRNIFYLLALITLTLSPIFNQSSFYGDMLFTVFLFAGMSAAWNLVGGFTGQISLGHTVFFGVGAYTSTLLYLHFGWSPWINLIGGGLVATIFGVILGYPCFRLKSHFFALTSIAFGQIMYFISLFWRELTNGANGLLIPFNPSFSNIIFDSKIPYTYLALSFMLITLFVSYLIRKSKFGSYLIAIREDQDAAESVGVNSSQYKLYIFMVSTFFTGIGGVLYARYIMYIDPASVFNIGISIQLGVISILGGLGMVLGPLFGAIIIIPLDILLRGWFGQTFAGLNYMIYGALLIVMIRKAPQGIVGWLKEKYQPYFESLLRVSNTQELYDDIKIKEFVLINKYGKKGDVLLEVNKINKRFGGLRAVKDVSFYIKQGEIVGLIGPNGAGKTTLFNVITGFYQPESGIIKFMDKKITGLRPPYKVCDRSIVRTFQLVKSFNQMTVFENVMVGAFHKINNYLIAEQFAKKIIQFVGLKKSIYLLAKNLTLCDKKRVELARALATNPRLLLLDEIMSGLNPTELNEFTTLLRKISNQGITLFIIEHVMKPVMTLSDRIIVLNYGEKIAEGPPKEVSENEKVIKAYLGEVKNFA